MNYVDHVIRAAKGDILSYEFLVANFQGMAISYAYNILQDFQLAEDAAQEAFVLMYSNIKALKEPKSFIAWFRKLVLTSCTRIKRKIKPNSSELATSISSGPYYLIEDQERSSYIVQALSQLSLKQREVFLLFYMFDKSYEEIAKDLNITLSAVANRLYFGKKKLKNIMLSSMISYLEGYAMDNKLFTKKVINSISRIYKVKSENYMFNACMQSAMRYLNENEQFDYVFFAGVTGDLFSQIWCSPKWQYNDSYSTVCHSTQVPIKAAFDACGYNYEYIEEKDIKKNASKYIEKIKRSIDKGYPVLSFGIVGPPVCSIICGYDENGAVLMGWAQFQDDCEKESNGFFRKRNGLKESQALIFFKGKKTTPPIADSIKKSILNIPMLATLKIDNISFGKKAFEKWAESLFYDENFTDKEMLDSAIDTYGSCIVQMGTNMHYMREYLTRAWQLCVDIRPLLKKLQVYYLKIGQEFEQLIALQGGYFYDKKKLLNKEFRVKLANQITEIGKNYDKLTLAFNDYNKGC